MREDKARTVAETFVGFLGLIVIFLFGMFWNWLFMREETGTLGWIIYFIGEAFLFVKFLDKLFKWFRRIKESVRIIRNK